MARKVDLSMLGQLVQGAEGQEVSKGNRKTTDSKFPVFATPVNEDILVYIPKVNCIETENGIDMKLLHTHIHDYTNGKQFGQIRCISNLTGNEAFDMLGYDGTCPACESTKECWSLHNKKLENEAKRLGVDVQDDASAEMLKPIKDKLRAEMEMRGAEEYVTFPVCIIRLKKGEKMKPIDDAVNKIETVFVTWRKKRYEDNIIPALEMSDQDHPAGMFMLWKFTYNTEGKQATARDSAKNAKYMVISDGTTKFADFIDACEESAKDFTLVKATEVLVANQFMYKEDMEVEVNKIVAKTRNMLALAEVGANGGQPQLGGAVASTPQLTDGVNPLAGFGNGESLGLSLDK